MTEDIGTKLDVLDQLADQAALCLKSRIAAWHVLSLYPGEPELKAGRRSTIQKAIESFQSLTHCGELIKQKIEGIDSFWNLSSTLQQRKSMLLEKCEVSIAAMARTSQQIQDAVERSDQLMEANSRPTRILLQFDDGARSASGIRFKNRRFIVFRVNSFLPGRTK